MDPLHNALESKDLEALLQSARDLTSQIALEELLKNILQKACELTDSPDASVILYNKNRNSLYFAEAIGENAEMLLAEWGEESEKNIPIHGSKSGEVFTTMKSLIIDNVEDHFKGVDKDTQKHTRSMVCVPLIVSGHCLGVMQLLNKKHGSYGQHDLLLLEHFSTLAAVAIRNAQLFKEIMIHMGFNTIANRGKDPLEFFEELEKPAHAEVITIFFVDMRGFTQLCQSLNNPQAAQRHLNEYLSLLTGEIISHNGMINKVLGDGILALFRCENHELDAVRCAFAMIDKFKNLKKKWDESSNLDLNFLDIGVGIVTDSVTIGTISGQYFRDFTVIGNAVNLAAAFEKNAKEGRRVLADQMTFSAAQELIEEFEGPTNFVLRKEDQDFGHTYKQYHIKKLKSGSTDKAS